MSTTTEHRMLSYIFEDADALDRTLKASTEQVADIVAEAKKRGCKRVILSGVGSSYTAALAARPVFDNLVDLPTYVLPATELALFPKLVNADALLLLLSRSGERKFLLDALATAEKAQALTVAVTGAAESLLAQRADRVVLTAEGPEASFPKTKSVIAGIGVFTAFGLALAGRGAEELGLPLISGLINEALADARPALDAMAAELFACDQVIIAGTAGNFGAAMEMQIKLQESALVTAQFMDTGNLFHGPLCVLNEKWLIILAVTAGDADVSSETIRLVRELGAKSLALVPSGVVLEHAADFTIELPKTPSDLFAPLVSLPVLQLLSYLWTVAKGVNPDSPPGSGVIMSALLPDGRVEAEARP
ncbi:MAG: glucosamine--fructose-6-phosphate aminotransferase (isomerizing) [Acidimicrobiaceae bacterium]|nr:glucosamine--fructose-6-phosphate aminotransferase (isomerizing) [Acidimicrobiaceae bacterium]